MRKDTFIAQSLEEIHLETIPDAPLFVYRHPETGEVYVAMKRACEALGIDWKSQRKKIQQDPLLSKGGVIITPPSAGGPQETLFLRRREFIAWLFRLQPSRLREDIRENLRAFQLEAMDALDRYFSEGVAVNPAAVRAAPQQVAQSFVRQTKEVLSRDRLSIAREALSVLRELEELTGQGMDVHTVLLIRETVADAMVLLKDGEVEGSAVSELWAVEDLRRHFPRISGKVWNSFRGSLGKELRKRGLVPVGQTSKLINGGMKRVNVYRAEDFEKGLSIARSYFERKGLL